MVLQDSVGSTKVAERWSVQMEGATSLTLFLKREDIDFELLLLLFPYPQNTQLQNTSPRATVLNTETTCPHEDQASPTGIQLPSQKCEFTATLFLVPHIKSSSFDSISLLSPPYPFLSIIFACITTATPTFLFSAQLQVLCPEDRSVAPRLKSN